MLPKFPVAGHVLVATYINSDGTLLCITIVFTKLQIEVDVCFASHNSVHKITIQVDMLLQTLLFDGYFFSNQKIVVKGL